MTSDGLQPRFSKCGFFVVYKFGSHTEFSRRIVNF